MALDPALLAILAAALAGFAAGMLLRARSASTRAVEADDAPLPPVDGVIDALEAPVLIVRAGQVLIANRAARAVLGDHIEGGDVRLAIRHPAAAGRFAEDADTRPSLTALTGLGDPGRRWEMAVAALPDGSRLARLTDHSDAHAAEQMRADFVANASHELRTPLATLIGYSETLQDDPDADEATRQRFLGIMSDEARRMQQLVDDLISLSRIEAERFSVPRDPVALLPLVDEIRESCSRLIEARRSRIAVEPGDLDPVVPGDRAQLLQLLRNLVVNALKYGRDGTDIVIRFADAGPDMLRIAVIDRGEGIAAEHLPRLTERFYRVDPSRSRAMGGTGLGLAIVKHIAQRHRGRVEIRSMPGEGTEVAILLPSLSRKSHAAVTKDTPIAATEARSVP